MGYLKENDRVSPLRSRSPRKPTELPDMSYMSRGDANRSSSPLRTSPRRTNGIVEARVPINSGQTYGSYDRVEQAEFAKVLKDNIFIERELESSKIETALKPDFNLLDAFKIFDTRGIGNVSV